MKLSSNGSDDRFAVLVITIGSSKDEMVMSASSSVLSVNDGIHKASEKPEPNESESFVTKNISPVVVQRFSKVKED